MSSLEMILASVWLAACASTASSSASETALAPDPEPGQPSAIEGKKPPQDYRHSPILNSIMKNEVNKPFSKLTFFVFHSDGDLDFPEIEKTTTELYAGIAKARAFPDPPVSSEQGREVFATFLENLDRDCTKLISATAQRDKREIRALLGKLSKTCNNCHHFFRLDIADSPEQ